MAIPVHCCSFPAIRISQLSTIEGMGAHPSQDCLPQLCIPLRPRSLYILPSHHHDRKNLRNYYTVKDILIFVHSSKNLLEQPQRQLSVRLRNTYSASNPSWLKVKIKLIQRSVICSPPPPLVLPTLHTSHVKHQDMRLAIFIFISTSLALLIPRCDNGYEGFDDIDNERSSDAL